MSDVQGSAPSGSGPAPVSEPAPASTPAPTQQPEQRSQAVPYDRFREVNEKFHGTQKELNEMRERYTQMETAMSRIGSDPELVQMIRERVEKQRQLDEMRKQGWTPPSPAMSDPKVSELEKQLAATRAQTEQLSKFYQDQQFERQMSEAERFVTENNVGIDMKDGKVLADLTAIVKTKGLDNIVDALKVYAFEKMVQKMNHMQAAGAISGNASGSAPKGGFQDDASALAFRKACEMA